MSAVDIDKQTGKVTVRSKYGTPTAVGFIRPLAGAETNTGDKWEGRRGADTHAAKTQREVIEWMMRKAGIRQHPYFK